MYNYNYLIKKSVLPLLILPVSYIYNQNNSNKYNYSYKILKCANLKSEFEMINKLEEIESK